MAPSPTRDDEPDPATVAVCYIVAVRDTGSALPALRIRFEFRQDVSSPRAASRSVLGIEAACDALRDWLATIAPA